MKDDWIQVNYGDIGAICDEDGITLADRWNPGDTIIGMSWEDWFKFNSRIKRAKQELADE